MPLYLVRWPELSASLVTAHDEDDLVLRLDEVADPGGCTWTEYDGPLWVDFHLPVTIDLSKREDNRPATVDDFEINLGELSLESWQFEIAIPPADTAESMMDAIRGFAFPALQAFIESNDCESIDTDELLHAIRADLRNWIEYEWRKAQVQRRCDPKADLMRMLRVTTPLPGLMSTEDNDEDKDS